MGGLALTLYLVATPVGWVMITVGGVSAVVGSLGGELALKKAYSVTCGFDKPFFVERLGSEWICP
jgi:hypothetical protein